MALMSSKLIMLWGRDFLIPGIWGHLADNRRHCTGFPSSTEPRIKVLVLIYKAWNSIGAEPLCSSSVTEIVSQGVACHPLSWQAHLTTIRNLAFSFINPLMWVNRDSNRDSAGASCFNFLNTCWILTCSIRLMQAMNSTLQNSYLTSNFNVFIIWFYVHLWTMILSL